MPRVSFTKIEDELSVVWPQLYFGLGFTTLATLILTLSERRIFSALGVPAAVFAIGAAFTGLGMGTFLAGRIARWDGNVWSRLGWLSLLNSLAVAAVLTFILSRDNGAGAGAAFIFLAAALPFVASGAVVVTVFREAAKRLDKACLAALSGAIAGCLLHLPFLTLFAGAPNTVLASGAMFAISAAIWFHQAGGNARRASAVLVALLFTWAMIVNGKMHWIDMRPASQSMGWSPVVALVLAVAVVAILRWHFREAPSGPASFDRD